MVVAGSGHGKTQTLQRLLVDDLEEVRDGNASVVKLVGGANAKDARLLASEMHCDAEYIQSMKKRERVDADFACMVRNVTPRAVRLSVPFGVMEALPAMNDEQYQELLTLNRARVCDTEGMVEDTGVRHEDEYESVFELGKQKAI